jgi:predicted dehydrogenase
MSKEKVIRIGFIGAGGIARGHAKYYKNIPFVKFEAVADIDIERAREFANTFGIPEENVFKDYTDMLDKLQLDGVSICTPHKLHAAPTIYALKRGVHVLVEKPMATTASEALEMLRTAIQYKRILMVGFQNRFSPEIVAARKFTEAGLLKGFYYGETIEGRQRRRHIPPSLTFISKEIAGGGVLLDLGCYAIDNAMYILGYPEVLKVSGHIYTALGKSKEAASVLHTWGQVSPWFGPWDIEKFDVEDFAVGKIVFRNGGVLWLKVAWAMHNDDLGRPFFLGIRGGIKLYPLEIFRDENGFMTTTTVVLPQKDAWIDKIGKFVEAIRKSLENPVDPIKDSPIDPRENVYEMIILDAIYQSAYKGGEEVKVQIYDEFKPIINNTIISMD